MIKNDTLLLQALLEDLNTLYEESGSLIFPQYRALLDKRPGAIIEDKNLTELIDKQKKEPSFDIGSRLLSTYCDQLKNPHMKVHSYLQEWVLSGLNRIANGENDNEVFGLKRSKGRSTGSVSKSDLQIVAAYEYQRRTGLKPTEAKEAVKRNLGVTSRTIDRARKNFKIGSHIKTDLLAEISQYDYGLLLGQ